MFKMNRELADYARSHFDYEYLALTDHSQAARIAGGLTAEEFRKQFQTIQKVNESWQLPS